jgi:hypothetical protein
LPKILTDFSVKTTCPIGQRRGNFNLPVSWFLLALGKCWVSYTTGYMIWSHFLPDCARQIYMKIKNPVETSWGNNLNDKMTISTYFWDENKYITKNGTFSAFSCHFSFLCCTFFRSSAVFLTLYASLKFICYLNLYAIWIY